MPWGMFPLYHPETRYLDEIHVAPSTGPVVNGNEIDEGHMLMAGCWCNPRPRPHPKDERITIWNHARFGEDDEDSDTEPERLPQL